MFEARRGLFPLGGSTVRLRRQIPFTVAMDLLLTARDVSAEEALRIGLIGRVVPDGTALDEALEIAEVICANGPLAVEAIKRSVRETEGMSETEALKIELEIGMPDLRHRGRRRGPARLRREASPRVPTALSPSDEGVSDFGITRAGAPAAPRGRREPGPDGQEDARFAVAAAVRRITSALVGRPIEDDELHDAATALEALADRLEVSAAPGRRVRREPDPSGAAQDFFPTSPVIGFANPISPPVRVELTESGLEGAAYFDYQYEGPPTCVHGGVIAMVFDELLGATNIAAGCPGMTGTLTIRYRRPTPLRTPLRLEARCLGQEGRKITTWGAIFDGEQLLAEAEGIFIQLVPERFLQVVASHGQTPPG